jgi:hypothetical protein
MYRKVQRGFNHSLTSDDETKLLELEGGIIATSSTLKTRRVGLGTTITNYFSLGKADVQGNGILVIY